MTNLSPAAQVVLDAAFPVYDEDNLYFVTCEQHAGRISAATLRAAAKVIAPEAMPHRRKIRAELLAIAAELEGGWNVGLPPAPGFYYVRGLLDESIGGDDRPVYVQPEYFVWAFTEKDDPELISLDSDITPENIRWKPAEEQEAER
jgi:hypothetical protein